MIGLGLLLYGVLRYLIEPLAVVFPPIIIAAVVTYVLNPVVGWLERRGMRRGLGVAIVFLGFLAAIYTMFALLIPVISRQLTSLLDQIPTYAQKITTEFNEFASRRGSTLRLEAPD